MSQTLFIIAIIPGIENPYGHAKRLVEPIEAVEGLKIPGAEKYRISQMAKPFKDNSHDIVGPSANIPTVHLHKPAPNLDPRHL